MKSLSSPCFIIVHTLSSSKHILTVVSYLSSSYLWVSSPPIEGTNHMLGPLPPPTWRQDTLRTPLALYLELPPVSSHVHESVLTLVTYQLTHSYISAFLLRRLFPHHYPGFCPETKLNWHTHVVSSVHSILISTVAVWIIFNDKEWRTISREPADIVERIHVYTGALGLLTALAQGYFIYHLVMATVHFKVFGVQTLFHAVSCCTYIFAFKPFFMFYARQFLLFEASNPFVNNHWFLKELGIRTVVPFRGYPT
ncbi:hypothetical protein ASPVEDRAFT_402505 [Aspergillus versicolor CBS 583.65]|uniref:TLC domain-containing protein n=1 Tax=Aspergillus versicolor CBS 583.65 TaxID=1036611 RepID=A0A1L9Q485_ASPVE|nr:uncharacterized protein ASPVEDRAFT_402505 [Aspergillus versicolor CBS 583.65]OJJ08539.1 hypothetical protein ASPVEDRAFT_402505 [Aspergillus versicolor CBS 583.65]